MWSSKKYAVYPGKITLTLSQALYAIQETGRWDLGSKTENVTAKATAPNAQYIRELGVTHLPQQLDAKSFSLSATKLYQLLEILQGINSRVEVLDLSDYKFDNLSLLTLNRSITVLYHANDPQPHRLKLIKLDACQLNMSKDICDELKASKSTVKFEFVNRELKSEVSNNVSGALPTQILKKL